VFVGGVRDEPYIDLLAFGQGKVPPMAASQDHERNLETLALFISGDVRSAMMASYVTFVADVWFYQCPDDVQRRLFRTNPANTLTYSSLKALFEQSVVSLSETLKDEHGALPIIAAIRRKADLTLHRHSISHPATVKWGNAKMQEFGDADREFHEYLPALVWDASRSINEELRKGDEPLRDDSIEATWEMATLLRTILEMSMNEEAPSRESLFKYLKANASKYQTRLEDRPDGGRDPEKEKERTAERRAKWEARRRLWAQRAETSEQT